MAFSVQLVGSSGYAGGLGYTMTAGGSVKPETALERQTYKRLQEQINAFIRKFMPGRQTLTVDGIIGQKTLDARNAIYKHAAQGKPYHARATVQEQANYALTDAAGIYAALNLRLPILGPTGGQSSPLPNLPSTPSSPVTATATPLPGKSKLSPYTVLAAAGGTALLVLGVMYVRRRQ